MAHTDIRSVLKAALVAATLVFPIALHAQVDCVAPRETQDAVATTPFAPIRQTLLSLEDIVRRNAAYQAAPEPVRMRTTIAAGPMKTAGARIFVRAYPPMQGTIRIWTPDRCDVVPQAERVAASVGQIYIFVNYNVREQFLGLNEVPRYDGEVAGYPVYNGWVVMTRNGRLPWTPQTLADRLDRVAETRQRALDDWAETKTRRQPLDEAAQMKTYEMLKKTDPAGAESFLSTVRETVVALKKVQADDALMDAHLQAQVNAVRDYRATFTPAQLASPAVWADNAGRERAQLEARLNAVGAAKKERAFFEVQNARAAFELSNLKPGTPAQAMAYKPDPTFFDANDPFRPQLITVNFWSKSEPGDHSPRSEWLSQAKATFDFAAVAALLR